jgi:nucleoside-triphosphatase
MLNLVMHIFLTGEKRAGKSVTIRKFLSQSGKTADGFLTYWQEHNDNTRTLYLSPASHIILTNPLTPSQSPSQFKIVDDEKSLPPYVLSVDDGRGLSFSEQTLEVFETYGVDILNNSGNNDLIIMDELGFLETKAPIFREKVMQKIEGNVPVLGVIKASKTEFLETIRNHPKVTVKEVTEDNRNEVLKWLLSKES